MKKALLFFLFSIFILSCVEISFAAELVPEVTSKLKEVRPTEDFSRPVDYGDLKKLYFAIKKETDWLSIRIKKNRDENAKKHEETRQLILEEHEKTRALYEAIDQTVDEAFNSNEEALVTETVEPADDDNLETKPDAAKENPTTEITVPEVIKDNASSELSNASEDAKVETVNPENEP